MVVEGGVGGAGLGSVGGAGVAVGGAGLTEVRVFEGDVWDPHPKHRAASSRTGNSLVYN